MAGGGSGKISPIKALFRSIPSKGDRRVAERFFCGMKVARRPAPRLNKAKTASPHAPLLCPRDWGHCFSPLVTGNHAHAVRPPAPFAQFALFAAEDCAIMDAAAIENDLHQCNCFAKLCDLTLIRAKGRRGNPLYRRCCLRRHAPAFRAEPETQCAKHHRSAPRSNRTRSFDWTAQFPQTCRKCARQHRQFQS